MSILMQESPRESQPEITPDQPFTSDKPITPGARAAARSFSVLTAMQSTSSPFIDFYNLLNEPENASASRLRARMAELYAEAQSNRDHRNPTTRRRYNDLLETLPKCRAVLLDTARRAQYDEYIMQSRGGASDVDFQTFIAGLTSAPRRRSSDFSADETARDESLRDEQNPPDQDEDFSEVIGVRDVLNDSLRDDAMERFAAANHARKSRQPVAATSPRAEAQSEREAQEAGSLSYHSEELQRDAALHLALMLRLASACGAGVFFLTLVVARGAMRESLTVALVAAAVLGAASWFGARQYLLRRTVRDEVETVTA